MHFQVATPNHSAPKPSSLREKRQLILDDLREPGDIFQQQSFRRVYTPDYGTVYASAGPLYANAVFGRDSIEVAEDLLELAPTLARDTILVLARLQGTQHRRTSDEQVGRIHHEHRMSDIINTDVAGKSKEIFEQISQDWGGDHHTVTYYGSLDATPLFIRLVCNYCLNYGSDFLETTFINKDGVESTVEESLKLALHWVVKRLDGSRSGFIEYNQASHDRYVGSHTWKDSQTAYIRKDGSVINYYEGFPTIEVQAYAYDALILAAQVLHNKLPSLAKFWQGRAADIQEKIIEHFWIEDSKYFASVLEYNHEADPKAVKVLTSSPATMLDTKIFDDEKLASTYIEPVVRSIFSDDMLSDIGVRCRALRHANLIPYADYHGSLVSWPKETYDIAKGLHSYGLHRLAQQLENRIVNGVLLSGDFYEFFYVDRYGRVDYDPQNINGISRHRQKLVATNVPEPGQAWVISAVLSIAANRSSPSVSMVPDRSSWQFDLEEDILSKMEQQAILTDLDEIEARYPKTYSFSINIRKGKRVARKHFKRLEKDLAVRRAKIDRRGK
ncbi:MAG: hypothetical protein WDZ42_00520 [Candidatus Saccharimonadales bacterium]